MKVEYLKGDTKKEMKTTPTLEDALLENSRAIHSIKAKLSPAEPQNGRRCYPEVFSKDNTMGISACSGSASRSRFRLCRRAVNAICRRVAEINTTF